MNDHSCLKCLLVCFFGLLHSPGFADRQSCCCGASCHYPGTFEHSVESRYLHEFLDSWIQVGDFKLASLVLGSCPYTQQCAQTRAIDVRNFAQINL